MKISISILALYTLTVLSASAQSCSSMPKVDCLNCCYANYQSDLAVSQTEFNSCTNTATSDRNDCQNDAQNTYFFCQLDCYYDYGDGGGDPCLCLAQYDQDQQFCTNWYDQAYDNCQEEYSGNTTADNTMWQGCNDSCPV